MNILLNNNQSEFIFLTFQEQSTKVPKYHDQSTMHAHIKPQGDTKNRTMLYRSGAFEESVRSMIIDFGRF